MMDVISNKIFKNKIFNSKKLLNFGFVKHKNNYIYTTSLLADQFKLIITISSDKNIETKMIDTATQDIYTLHLVNDAAGTFVGLIREAYENILEQIADKCCNATYFSTEQANRLTELIKEKYGNSPEFLWEKFPGFGVFRNPESEKWYGLISHVDYSKLDNKKNGDIEILNIKLDKDKIPNLQKIAGFYPAYHMNKKSWITIVLNETVSDKKIMKLVDKSHKLSDGKAKIKNVKSEWLVPANPKLFDVGEAFKQNNEIIWKQSSNIKAGDIIYLYIGSPVSAVKYKCKATKVNIPYNYEDENIKISKVMRIKLLKEYDKDFLTFKRLNNYGINAVRGPRNIPQKLSAMLNQKG